MKIFPEIINEEPLIVVFNNVFTKSECDYILKDLSDDQYEKCKTFDIDTGEEEEVNYRTSSEFDDKDFKYDFITEKIGKILSLDLNRFEKLQIIKYKSGEEYQPHHDFFNHAGNSETFDNNDRDSTAITYLNDNYEEGETHFPELDIKIKPKKGSVLYFEYGYDYETNLKTLHAGLPVKSGTKYISSSFIRSKQWDVREHPDHPVNKNT